MEKLLDHGRTITWDRVLVLGGIAYVVLPILLFLYGWLKLYIAVPALCVFLWFSFRLYKAIATEPVSMISGETRRYWIICLIFAAAWVYLSGIGSYVYQNDDFWVRNPIFRDLSHRAWPMVFDLSYESELVQSVAGSERVGFSYYFAWWLPVAALTKAFHFGEAMSNFLLYLWALCGIMLVIYFLNRTLGKCSLIVPFLLIFFSGLDALPTFVINERLPVSSHIEQWAYFFQYSSNTTQLFWVMNQSIPIWVLVALLLQLKDNRYVAGLCSLAFAYSPWATFGMIPYAAAGSFSRKEKPARVFNSVNICVPILMLLVFGLFYMSSNGMATHMGFVISYYHKERRRFVFSYLLFVLLEALIYFIILGEKARKYPYYWVTLVELVLFPLYIVRDGNFIMRGSIPALFMLMVYAIRYLDTNWNCGTEKIRKWALVTTLCIGMITPLNEINRTVKRTLTSDDLLQEDIGSFGDIRTENTRHIEIAKSQFFVYDYENTPFYRYLGQ